MKIAIAGIGYVGLSLAVLLAARHDVVTVDIDPAKVELLNRRCSPLRDRDVEKALAEQTLSLTATLNAAEAYRTAQVIIAAVPTDYDDRLNCFNTEALRSVIRAAVAANPAAIVVIKSTVPVGFTAEMQRELPGAKLLFSPEFLREGRALYDNLHPSRIVVGADMENPAMAQAANIFAELLREGSLEDDTPVLLMGSTEAEAVKLFSNTYLAMRVAYFNELDTYAAAKGLNAGQIISGVCLDPRIGDHYNNPSFGYGGYCLPKDSRQLRSNFAGIPNGLIDAVVKSNHLRKDFIAGQALQKAGVPENCPPQDATVGIYRLTMKAGSDNFRTSAVLGIIRRLREQGLNVLIYEPTCTADCFDGCRVESDLAQFKNAASVILANRPDAALADVSHKVYTRDLFGRD